MNKKYLSIILAIVMVCMMVSPTYAIEDEVLTINFNTYRYTLHDYTTNSAYVEYLKNGTTEMALIKSKDNNEVLETITSSPNLDRSYDDHIHAYNFTRETRYGKIKLLLTATVELYSEGSFRQINAIQASSLVVSSAIASTFIEDKSVSVWSKNGFPTSELLYGYSGVLTVNVGESVSAEVAAELLGSGFTAGYSSSTTTYYRRPFQEVGSFSVY